MSVATITKIEATEIDWLARADRIAGEIAGHAARHDASRSGCPAPGRARGIRRLTEGRGIDTRGCCRNLPLRRRGASEVMQ
jgi:hypothetical protein